MAKIAEIQKLLKEKKALLAQKLKEQEEILKINNN